MKKAKKIDIKRKRKEEWKRESGREGGGEERNDAKKAKKIDIKKKREKK